MENLTGFRIQELAALFVLAFTGWLVVMSW